MVTFFIPKEKDCAVNYAFDMLSGNQCNKQNSLILEERYNHIDDVYAARQNLFKNNSKKLFFGHGLADGSAIESMHGNLERPWWKSSRIKYELAVFHACHGAKFFSKEEIVTKYENWVSYDNELHMICGSKIIATIWKTVFSQLAIALQESNSSAELKWRLIQIYDDAIAQTIETVSGPMGEFTIAHLEQAIINLRTDNDYK